MPAPVPRAAATAKRAALTAAQPCRLCRHPVTLAWGTDEDGPVHPCCVRWAAEVASTGVCPACLESRRAAARWGRRRTGLDGAR